MSGKLRVEPATPADLSAIRGAYARGREIQREQGESVWPEFAEDALLAEIRAGTLLRIMDDDTVAGVFSAVYEDPAIWGELERGQHIYLHRIARAENYSGGSIVEALVSWAVARCEELGREGLRIDTWATNAPLNAYYAKFGFQFVGHRRMPADPRLSVHYHGTELALLERPLRSTKQPA